jgi:hypothetical protein
MHNLHAPHLYDDSIVHVLYPVRPADYFLSQLLLMIIRQCPFQPRNSTVDVAADASNAGILAGTQRHDRWRVFQRWFFDQLVGALHFHNANR